MDNNQYKNLLNQSSFFKNIFIKINASTNIQDKTKLNIGAGPNIFPHPGWINYDRETFDEYFTYLKGNPSLKEMPDHQKKLTHYLQNNGEVDFRIHDIKSKFFQHIDNSVDCIYVGQTIEHINPNYEAPLFLKECHRMLKLGGVLRMTTPDLDLLIKAYISGDMSKFSSEQPDFYKLVDPSSQLSYIMFGAAGPKCSWNNYEGHMFLYTQTSMNRVLQEAGFKNIHFYYETGISHDPILAKEVVDAGMSHSFIVEAIK